MNKNENLTPTSFLSMREDFHQEDAHFSDLDQKRSGILLMMKFHLCFVSFSNTPVPSFSVPTLCSWSDGSVLSRFLLRKHCRVGTFIRIDFLFPCCCAAHFFCPIQTRLMLTRPCIFVAWLKPLHPSHLEVWFFQPCHHTHISSLPGH